MRMDTISPPLQGEGDRRASAVVDGCPHLPSGDTPPSRFARHLPLQGRSWGRLSSALTLLPLALTACGSAAPLTPKPGQSLPVAPVGARARPNAVQLLRPTAQMRPQRSDELLTSSQARRSDAFELPLGDNQH